MNKEFWIVGKELRANDKEIGWMLQGLFELEKDAVSHVREDEFIALIDFNARLPDDARDSKKIYWPHLEKCWEESVHYELKQAKK